MYLANVVHLAYWKEFFELKFLNVYEMWLYMGLPGQHLQETLA